MLLAGVSVDYCTRLERGHAHGASENVLGALARALQLDEAERAHLFDLVQAASPTARAPRRPARQQVRPNVRRILDSMTTSRPGWRPWRPPSQPLASRARRTSASVSTSGRLQKAKRTWLRASSLWS